MQPLSEAAPSCGACPESAIKGAASPASVKLSSNLQADSSSNARYLGLDKSQTRLVHKEGIANGRCCTKRRSRFRASQTRLRLGERSHTGGGRLRLQNRHSNTQYRYFFVRELHPSSCKHSWVAAVQHHFLREKKVRNSEQVPVDKTGISIKESVA